MDEQAMTVARDFMRSWEDMSPDGYASWFTEDAVFDDVPVGVHVGREAIRAAAAKYPPTTCEILRIVADDGVVVVERVDHFEYRGATLALRVLGLFEITADGRVALQRDYYDMKGLMAELEAAGIRVEA
jgi:limonene-1,2-epoxide hydrolase